MSVAGPIPSVPDTAPVVVGSPSRAWPMLQQAVRAGALAVPTLAVVAWLSPLLGMTIPVPTLLLLGAGAVVIELAPSHPFELVALVGLAALTSVNPTYAAYHVVVVIALFLTRRRIKTMALTAATLALLVPKELFRSHYHHPGYYNWLNEPSLALVIFATALWCREREDGRLPASARNPTFAAFASLFLFPGHAVNPLVYGASDLMRTRRRDGRSVVLSLSLFAAKALAHAAIVRNLPSAGYDRLSGGVIHTLSWPALWAVVLVNYVDLALTLSGTADLAVTVARLYGWPMASPFRWALLAWNPVELWRRWGLYNRRWLLALVYHPLGGGHRHRYRNILLTFLASALVMHSGWFGSKYWTVGVAGWRDEVIYFGLQGVAVCAWVAFTTLSARASSAEQAARTLRWSWGRAIGTIVTQASSAVIHVVILAQALSLPERFAVLARCLCLTR